MALIYFGSELEKFFMAINNVNLFIHDIMHTKIKIYVDDMIVKS